MITLKEIAKKCRGGRKRLRNFICSIQRKNEIRRGAVVLKSTPATINIELTGRCNIKPACTFCVGKNLPDYNEPGNLPLEQYWPYLLQAKRVNDCSYGEPLLAPLFDEVVEKLSAAGVMFGFTSNGLLLNEKRVRFLVEHAGAIDMCVSLNAASPKTYYEHHGKDFTRVIANLERFIALHRANRPGKFMPLVLSFIVMRSNQHEVFDFLRLARRLGVRCALLRHLFDMRVGDFNVNNFGHHFVYESERLSYREYEAIEQQVRNSPEFADEFSPTRSTTDPHLEIYFGWNGKDSFIAEQAEKDVDIPCLFPWKFLCIRPLHNIYTPCVYMKKGIEVPSNATIEEVWNGPVMVEIRRSLAAKKIPEFCMSYGDCCPLVLEARAKTSDSTPILAEGSQRSASPRLVTIEGAR